MGQLSDELLHGIYSKGFESPSHVQSMAIIPMKEGRDVIAQAQSGTGKTAAFAIGSLATIDPRGGAQVLVLEPVRELAAQTYDVYTELAHYMRDVHVAALYVGMRLDLNKRSLRNAHVVVGTPGRVLDCVHRGWLRLDQIKTVILDEADELMSRGFEEQCRDIVQGVPSDAQIGVFSATFTPANLHLSEAMLRSPVPRSSMSLSETIATSQTRLPICLASCPLR